MRRRLLLKKRRETILRAARINRDDGGAFVGRGLH
jgi:hypothetical protein